MHQLSQIIAKEIPGFHTCRMTQYFTNHPDVERLKWVITDYHPTVVQGRTHSIDALSRSVYLDAYEWEEDSQAWSHYKSRNWTGGDARKEAIRHLETQLPF